MMRIIFVIFVLLPLLELYVLIEVGSGIGGFTTIVLCLLTAAAGGLIIRWQGLQTLINARKSMQQAQQHQLAEHGLHGIMLVLAGGLLFFPGFLTDTLGFLLLIPALRKFLMRGFALGMALRFQRSQSDRQYQGQHQAAKINGRYDDVIDAQVIDKANKDEYI
ncbi:MAG: FxsA family protein [Ghiorsea sp.]